MPDQRRTIRQRVAPVRVRVTLAATAVSAAAMFVAGWFIVRSVDHSLLERAEAQRERELEYIAARIEAGLDPREVVLLRQTATPIYVQIQDLDGDVLASNASAEGGEPVALPTYGAGPSPLGKALVSSETVLGRGRAVQVVAASPLAEIRRSLSTLRDALWVGLPSLVAVVAAVAWVATGRALRPVDRVRTEVEAITGTTLHRRVPEPGTGDEIDRLANTMNAMLDRIEVASERQKQFVADASHELRSPVSAIRAQLEVAMQYPDRTDWEATARTLLAEEGRLEALIADLLLLASLEDAAPASTGEVDLARIATDEAARVHRDGIEVSCTAPAPLAVRGSATLLARLVANLLANGVRHARSRVEVAAHRRDGRARLIVDDDGTGVPEPDRARIFERFTRLEEARSRDSGGAGLGLALARRIARQHGGDVTVDTAPLGGARFVVDLPAGGT